ncbi:MULTISPECIES: VTT domain-containing protein [Micrococcaceae]|uniref:DedA protein n=1 Tax=Arthrobacter rhombi TaxID=71253 RepID=A0A1R4G939_9MICC|nr:MULTISPECIES: VTT domain-containing protein [Micrococcaceae]SJM64750.1 DedA protein [Arthrobacter rhombi]
MIDALSPALDAAVTLQPQMAGLLPDFLNPDVFLRDPRLAPWIVLLVCGIVFAETGLLVGFFLPGDSMLFTAGLLVATGAIDVNLWVFAGCVFLAAFAGDQTGYLIGHKAGPAVFNKPDSRFFRKEYVDKAHEFFERFGGRAVILARFVPIVRTFVPVIAGVAKMHYRTFIAFNLVGALLWGVGVTLLGHWLGQYAWVGNNIDIIFVAIVLLSVVPIAVELIKARRKPAQK